MKGWVIGAIIFFIFIVIIILIGVTFYIKNKETTCKTSSDCEDNQICLNGTCKVKLGCDDDEGCAEGEVCDLGICVKPNTGPTACTTNEGCKTGQRCGAGYCLPLVVENTDYYLTNNVSGYISQCPIVGNYQQTGSSSSVDKASVFNFKILKNNESIFYQIFDKAGNQGYMWADDVKISHILVFSKKGVIPSTAIKNFDFIIQNDGGFLIIPITTGEIVGLTCSSLVMTNCLTIAVTRYEKSYNAQDPTIFNVQLK